MGQNHPLRAIRAIVNEALAGLAGDFSVLYSPIGRPSIPPEKRLRAMLLQALFDPLEAAADGPAGGEGMSAPMNCQLIGRWRIVEADIS